MNCFKERSILPLLKSRDEQQEGSNHDSTTTTEERENNKRATRIVQQQRRCRNADRAPTITTPMKRRRKRTRPAEYNRSINRLTSTSHEEKRKRKQRKTDASAPASERKRTRQNETGDRKCCERRRTPSMRKDWGFGFLWFYDWWISRVENEFLAFYSNKNLMRLLCWQLNISFNLAGQYQGHEEREEFLFFLYFYIFFFPKYYLKPNSI